MTVLYISSLMLPLVRRDENDIALLSLFLVHIFCSCSGNLFFLSLSDQFFPRPPRHSDFAMLNYAPSVLAASAVIAARSILGVGPCWAPGLLSASGFVEADLIECVQRLWSISGKQVSQESPANRHDVAALILTAPPPLMWDQHV